MKNKLVLASLALLVSAITLIAASYAWFTMNNTVSATGLQLTAATPAIVEISLDGQNWEARLPCLLLLLLRPTSMNRFKRQFYEPTVNTHAVTENAEGIFKQFLTTSGNTYQYYYDVDLYPGQGYIRLIDTSEFVN